MEAEELNVKNVRRLYQHDSLVRRLWSIAMLLVTLYNAIALPYRSAFCYPERWLPGQEADASLWYVLVDLVSDLPNVVSIVLNARYFTRYDTNGALITRPDEILPMYLKQNFVIDMLICLPVDLLAFGAGVRRIQLLALLRLPRLVSLRYMGDRFQDFINLLDHAGVKYTVGVWQSIKMFSTMIVLTHWCGCGYFIVAWAIGFADSWTEGLNVSQSTIMTQYTASLYWAAYTVSTVGFGDIKPVTVSERIFAIAAMFIGAVLCDAGLTAVLTALVDTRDAKAADNVARVQCIKKYMHYRDFPLRIQNSVQDYLVYNAVHQAGLDENEILDSLSFPMRSLVINSLCFDFMCASSIFSGLRACTLTVFFASR